MMRQWIAAGVALALLAGCGTGAPDSGVGNSETGEANATQPVPAEPSPVAEPTPTPTPSPTPAPSPSASTPPTIGMIPDAFRGVWAGNKKSCAPGGETRMEIAPDKLVFYESVGTPRELIVLGASEIRLTLEFTGEGETWVRSSRLTLQDGGKRLLRAPDGAASVQYIKC